mgnify:CR=1 FL=1
MKITLQNESFELLPDKALFWERKGLLALSDLHLGKAESIQAAGVPIPSGAHREDLERLSHLLLRYQPKEVLILGDLVHNRHSLSENVMSELHEFLNFHSQIYWTLIYGNHDKAALTKLRLLPFHFTKDDLQIENFLFVHGHHKHPEAVFQIQGHVHPAIRLQEGPLKMTLPCFHLTQNELTLPAFGSLTGGYILKPRKSDRVFAIANRELFEVLL